MGAASMWVYNLGSHERGLARAWRRVMRWFVVMVVGVSAAASTLVWVSPAAATLSGEEGLIAFVSDRDGNDEIYVMEADGSNQRNLTNHPASDSSPSWSPNGRELAFVSDRTGAATIWLMGADGSDLRELIPGTQPAWSPDGSQIAFTDVRDFDQVPVASIWVVNVDGTGLTRVTSPETDPIYIEELQSGSWVHLDIWDSGPVWFPDGESILFHRYRASYVTYDMMELDPLSGTVGALPIDLRSRGGADIAPDGDRVLFRVLSGMQGQSILLMYNLATDEYEQTGVIGSTWIGRFSWSPQGTRYAAALAPSGTDTYIAIVNPDGPTSVIANSPDANDLDPAWQPLNPYPMGLVDPVSGVWHLRDASGKVASFFYGNPGDYPFMGDWDCDGIDTPGLYRQTDGYVYLRNSNTQGDADLAFYFGNPGDVPIAGDFNGDGCDTVSVYRPSQSQIFIVNTLGSADTGLGAADHDYYFGDPGDTPFVGDFDGDGTDTIGLYRQTTGFVYYRNTHTQGTADNQFYFGNPQDRFVTNDWNHDGIDSPAIYRPGNTTHYFRFNNTEGNADARYIWGEPDWLPVTGTYTHN
jgi:Tol biopolymer transport system component